ncbi:MAG: hypothetical protein WAZ34_07815 [Rhodocyclaceae bacterium]
MKRFSPAPHAGFLQKVVATLLAIALLILGVMFSLVLLSVLAVAGLIAWGYFFWKTRALRKAIKEATIDAPTGGLRNGPSDGQVIEGEAIVVREDRQVDQKPLPRD